MMHTTRHAFCAALVAFAMGGPGAYAQGQSTPPTQPSQSQPVQDQSQPIPAYHPPGGIADSDWNNPQELEADTHSLAGAQDLTLGAPKTGYNYWIPHIDVSTSLDSNPLSSSGSSGWNTFTELFGGLDLHHTASNSDLRLSYLGGGAFSNQTGVSGGTFQQLGVAETLTLHRTIVTLIDQLIYTPEASFGNAGIGVPGLGVGGTVGGSAGGNVGLQSGFAPNQSIVTAFGQRLSNAAVAQANTFVTRRGSLTFVGAYSNLDYFDNALNNTTEATVQAGYNYLMSRKDTVAFFYRFNAFRYNNLAQSINDNSVQASYSRRITGRMAFQVSAGPDIAFVQTPIQGAAGAPAAMGTSGATRTRQFFWDLNSSLNYRLERRTLNALYSHSVTSGSGVLAGAVTDNFSGTVSQLFTRSLNGSLSIGYSRNRGVALAPTSSVPAGSGNTQIYDYWFASANLNRAIGRSLILAAGYQLNYQTSSTAFCITPTCGTSFTQHEIFISVGWHPRPMPF